MNICYHINDIYKYASIGRHPHPRLILIAVIYRYIYIYIYFIYIIYHSICLTSMILIILSF